MLILTLLSRIVDFLLGPSSKHCLREHSSNHANIVFGGTAATMGSDELELCLTTNSLTGTDIKKLTADPLEQARIYVHAGQPHNPGY